MQKVHLLLKFCSDSHLSVTWTTNVDFMWGQVLAVYRLQHVVKFTLMSVRSTH